LEEVIAMKKAYAFLSTALLASGLTMGALSPGVAHADEKARMQGTISIIDHTSGKIELKTEKGPAVVYFAPEALKNLKLGDQVKLEVELESAKVTSSAKTPGKVTSEAKTAKEWDMEQRFPPATKPNEDIPTKSKQVGS
jgi:hypothetical protein